MSNETRAAFEVWMRSEESPLNTEVPFDSEIAMVAQAAWQASRKVALDDADIDAAELNKQYDEVVAECDDHAQQLRKEQLTVQELINELAECRNLLGLTRGQVGLRIDAARYRAVRLGASNLTGASEKAFDAAVDAVLKGETE
jgi:hypothetical protein